MAGNGGDDNRQKSSTWQGAAGPIAAALIAAAVAAAGFVLSSHSGDSHGANRAQAAGSAATAGQAGPPIEPSATFASPSPTFSINDYPILWQGNLKITDAGMDIDQTPPGPYHGCAFATLCFNPDDRTLSTANSAPAAAWSSSTNPTFDDCVNTLATEPLSSEETKSIRYQPGLGLCIKGFNGGAIGFFRFTAAPTVSGADGYVIAWPPQ